MPNADLADLYATLGVSRTASDEEIRRAYRRQALRWHPDKNPDNREESEVMFKEVARAYEVLSNAAARRMYDATGRVAGDAADPQNSPVYSGGRPTHTNAQHGHFGDDHFAFCDPFDLFSRMFAAMKESRDEADTQDVLHEFFADPFFQTFQLHPFQGSNGFFSSSSSTSFSRGGGAGSSTSVSSTTTIQNGRKVTRTVRRVMRPDGTVTEDVDEKVEDLQQGGRAIQNAQNVSMQQLQFHSEPPAAAHQSVVIPPAATESRTTNSHPKVAGSVFPVDSRDCTKSTAPLAAETRSHGHDTYEGGHRKVAGAASMPRRGLPISGPSERSSPTLPIQSEKKRNTQMTKLSKEQPVKAPSLPLREEQGRSNDQPMGSQLVNKKPKKASCCC
jgi:DnaJ family protein B protein 6